MANKNKKLTTKEQEREFIIECIHLYRDLPTLWNVKSKEYHDRDRKSNAYDLLLSKYKEMFPQASKDDVKKKFNSLRTNYRKERKKHLQSMNSESGTDDIYDPTLWYYSEMDFLHDQECASDSQSSVDLKSIQVTMDVENKDKNISDGTSQFSTNDAVPKKKLTTVSVSRKKLIKSKMEDELIDSEYKRLKETTNEYQHWAMACAADLEKMKQMQQIFAKRAIAEILMEGRLGLLHRNSVKINEPPMIAHYRNPPSVASVQYSSTPSPSYVNAQQNLDQSLNNNHNI